MALVQVSKYVDSSVQSQVGSNHPEADTWVQRRQRLEGCILPARKHENEPAGTKKSSAKIHH